MDGVEFKFLMQYPSTNKDIDLKLKMRTPVVWEIVVLSSTLVICTSCDP